MAIDCGIDIGTTNLKVVLVDDEGRVVYVRAVPSPRVHDGSGIVTDAVALVSQIEDMILDGWRQVGHGAPLRSITTTGVGEDGIGIRADLTPTGFSIPWFDRRAGDELSGFQRLGGAADRIGISIASDRTLVKWAWLRRHRPDELDKASNWIALTDYPAVVWSGAPFMSISLAPRTACFDIERREWVESLLEAVGAPRMPPILAAGAVVGTMRPGRLVSEGAASSRTVVAAGGHAHPVAASVFKRSDATCIVDSSGTANLLYGELASGSIMMRHPDVALSIPPGGQARLACIGAIELNAALAAGQQLGAAFWSYLAHPTLPHEPARTVAGLKEVGVNPRGLRRSLERGTLEARRLLVAMIDMGVPQGSIWSSGGWSRSRGFAELRASIFGQPLRVTDNMELTAIGAALFGAEAAGASAENPIRPESIMIIDPVARWMTTYDELFSMLHEGGTSGLVS